MTNQMLRRLRREFLPLHQKDPFDTLIVFGGVNDLYSDLSAGRTNDKIESDLASIYATAKDLGLRVVAVTVSPWGGFSRYYNQRRGQNTRLLNSWILGRPAEGGVDVVVDSYPILSCGTPDKLCPEYQGPRPDGLHPGKRGHEILGQALKDKAFADCR
jgi:lysophospholipase L1-like esterase